MFNFLSMANDYSDRAVDRYEADGMIIDTAYVTDGDKSYETGICHPEYNKGNWVIVEAYDTKDEAKEGHSKWVAKMTSANLPASLKYCQNAGISQLFGDVDGSLEFPRTIEAG